MRRHVNDPARGISVNVGVVRGGTKPNVIAEEAYAEVDLRVPTISDSDELTAKILNLKSRTEGVSVKVVGELNRPPYEKSNAGAALYEHARTIAAEIGFDLENAVVDVGGLRLDALIAREQVFLLRFEPLDLLDELADGVVGLDRGPELRVLALELVNPVVDAFVVF